MDIKQKILSLPGFQIGAGIGFPVLSAEWRDLNGPFGGDIFKVKWCRMTPERLWAGSSAGVLFFQDGRDTAWKRQVPPVSPRSWVQDIVMTTGAERRLLAAFGNGTILGSEDGGSSWQNCSAGLPGAPIRCLDIHPLHPGIVLAGTDSGLYLSPDGGLNWTPFHSHAGFRRVTAIGFHPENPLVFYIADFNGFFPRVHKTTDGGASFRAVLTGPGKFSLIHTLIIDPRDHSVWAAGINGAWGVAHSPSGEPDTWTPIHTGLPALRVSCLAGPADGTMWAGTDGAGLYRLEGTAWKRTDIDPTRRFVKSIDVLNGRLAAGFQDGGVAILRNNLWKSTPDGMSARWVRKSEQVSGRSFALSDDRLFEKHDDDSPWSSVSGFRRVKDICSAPGKLLALDTEFRLFAFEVTSNTWKDKQFPHTHGQLVRAAPTGQPEMVITLAPGDRIRAFVSDTGNPPWRELGDGIEGPLEIYDAVVQQDGQELWAAVSTVAGLYTLSGGDPAWRRHISTAGPDIRPLAVSPNEPSYLYAGAGKTLFLSKNKGRSFEPGYLLRFPSDIQHISVSGSIPDTLWVCTKGGGVYVSFRPGIWNTLTPEETGIVFNHIAPSGSSSATYLLSTGGTSVIALSLPTLSIRWEKSSNDNTSYNLYLTIDNPAASMEIDFHLVGLPKYGPAVFYRFDSGHPEPVPEPAPLAVTLKKHTFYPEVYIGSVAVEDHQQPFCLLAGLFRKGTWEPVADIVTTTIGPNSPV